MENEAQIEEVIIVEKKENKPKQQSQIAGAIIIAGLIIGGAILLKSNTQVANNKVDYSKIKMRSISPEEHILGNKDAKVVIVEYSDSECPFCKVFDTTMHKVIEQKGDKVAWVYRHYPIPQLHPKAKHEAEAMECAYEQGGNDAFWEYSDQVFTRTESNNKLDVTELPKIATDIGLNIDDFNTCLGSGKFIAKIDADIADGDTVMRPEERGTPRSYILKKGKIVDVIEGAQPLEQVLQKLDKVL